MLLFCSINWIRVAVNCVHFEKVKWKANNATATSGQAMPKREEASQVWDTPLDVWVHTGCVLGGAHAGSVAKFSCLICPCVMLCREEGSTVLRECWAASRICLHPSTMEGRVLAGSLILGTYLLLKGLIFFKWDIQEYSVLGMDISSPCNQGKEDRALAEVVPFHFYLPVQQNGLVVREKILIICLWLESYFCLRWTLFPS